MTRQPTNPEQAPATKPTRTPRRWPDFPMLRPRVPRRIKRDHHRYPLPPYPGEDTSPDTDRNA